MDALVTDVHARGPVAGLRGLGEAGVRVIAVGPSRRAPGLSSRYAAIRAVAPDSSDDPAGFRDVVGELARRHGPLVVYPGQEESIDALMGGLHELPAEALLPYSRPEAVSALRDKVLLPALIAGAEMSTPETLATGSAEDVARVRVRTPCVVKTLDKLPGTPSARVVETSSGYRETLAALPPDCRVIAQECREGPLTSLALVVGRDGEPVARFQQVALRTWPAKAGSSRLAVSVEPDEKLTRNAAAALAGAGFSGLAQLQFVGGALIDVNPRYYGSLPLALRCGVNLPAAWQAVVTGAPLPRSGDYRVGVSFRWLEADLLAAVHGSPAGLLQRVPRPRVGAMWWPDDPWPGVLLGGAALSGWLRRRVSRVAPGTRTGRRTAAGSHSAHARRAAVRARTRRSRG